MKLDEIRYFYDECRTKLQPLGVEIFYHHAEAWNSLSQDLPVTPALVHALDQSIKAPETSYHAPKSGSAWFYFSELKATVRLEFTASPAQKTRESYRQRIHEIRINAHNAYRVAHSELTGLLARASFRDLFESQITDFSNAIAGNIQSLPGKSSSPAMFVLALDIDKFKQVNDTFGHLYGDQVLKAFSMRLEDAANSNKAKNSTAQIWLSHPSGEEFNVLVRGNFSPSDIAEAAEAFRSRVEEEALPSENEWDRLKSESDLTNISFPSVHDRKVTASIGLVSYKPAVGGQTPSSTVMELLENADTALYRSKAGGRNRVTFFDDILANCGRVLEHDLDTGVIVIDIGSKVGVEFGQEFVVFDETFSGQVPFTLDDGRSKRTLGIYPKVPLGRVVVFEAQREISFARPSPETQFRNQIKPNARLESVPLGSFTHILESVTPDGGGRGFLGQSITLSTVQELQKEVERLAESGSPVRACVFTFNGQADYLQKFGSVSLNRALASLYSNLDNLPSLKSAKKGLIDKTSVCAVGAGHDFNVPEIETLLSSQAFGPNGGLRAIGGYFSSTEDLPVVLPSPGSDDEQHILQTRLKRAIEWARYALTDFAPGTNQQFQAFGIATADRRLARLRLARQFEQAIVDYQNLAAAGVSSEDCLNAAGICYYMTDRRIDAFKAFRDAAAINDSIGIRLNLLIAAEDIGEVDIGLNALSYDEIIAASRDPDRQHAAYTYALLQLQALQLGLPAYSQDRFKEVARQIIVHPNTIIKQFPGFTKIKEALAQMEQAPLDEE